MFVSHPALHSRPKHACHACMDTLWPCVHALDRCGIDHAPEGATWHVVQQLLWVYPTLPCASYLAERPHFLCHTLDVHWRKLLNLCCLQSFWQPQNTPDSAIRAEKPSMDVMCPVSGKKLRLKDLTPVKFTSAPEDSGGKFMDPLSKDILSNSSTIVILKPTGDAMLASTFKQCVEPDGQYEGVVSCLGSKSKSTDPTHVWHTDGHWRIWCIGALCSLRQGIQCPLA
jgi:hypothetical protein